MGPGNSTVVGGCAVLLDIGTNPFGLLNQRVPENHLAIYILLYSGPRLINIYGKTAKKPDPSLSPKRLQTSALPIQVDLPRQ